jgi:membrane protease YdiL (CAAX protease family)
MIGYLFARLKERGLSDRKILWISALVRGSYHLYQGVGGFVGNIVMGLVFGKIFQKTGRLLPLLFAHFLLDAVVFVGYAWAKTFLPFL